MIITLCGSARFERLFKAWNEALTLSGHTVFSLAVYPSDKSGKNWYTEEEKKELDAAHFRKIEASDAIFVLNRYAYIGESTLREVKHAQTLNKKLYALEHWGEGLGIGDSHHNGIKNAMIQDGLEPHSTSPISTYTSAGWGSYWDLVPTERLLKITKDAHWPEGIK